jgi:NAD+ kinase
MGLIQVVGLVLHPRRDCEPAVDTIIDWARGRGVTVLGLPEEIGRIDCSAVAVGPDELVDRAALLVSLGGDGTMLRTMRLVEGRKTPVLGVNVGRLGFLAEVDVSALPTALSAIDEDRYAVEPRTAVRAVLPDGTPVSAFNDIALVRIPGHGLAAVGIAVEGHSFVRYAADAVIVSTPTGSTAYSFSVGGPIVSPNVEGLLVGAAAAHSSFNRSLLLSLDERLVLDVLPSSGRLAVEVDGIVRGYVSAGDTVPVSAVRSAAQVVRLGRTTFYERARRKLRVAGSAEVVVGDTSTVTVVDSFSKSRYEIQVGGEPGGWLVYRRFPDHIEFLHTQVDPAFQGRGLAGRLAAGALDDVRAGAGRAVVTCPYLAGYVERHPEYADLLVTD